MSVLKKLPRGAFFILVLLFCTHTLAIATDPFEITLEGYHEQIRWYRHHDPVLDKTQTYKYLHSSLIQKTIKVAFNHNPTGNKQLVVMIPGTFGEIDSAESISLGDMLYKKGYNILRLPNPLSHPVVDSNMNYKGMDQISEARLYMDFAEQIKKEYGLGTISLVGSSYGAFTTAVMASLYGKDFKGKVILLSPPYNLQTSLQKIDNLFEESIDDFSFVPLAHVKFMLQMQWTLFRDQELDLSPELAKSVLVWSGFHRGFRCLTNKVYDFDNHSIIPYYLYKGLFPKFREEQKNLRFISYLKTFNPGFFENQEKHQVLFWLNKIPGQWLIVTSPDDFINNPNVWPKSPAIKSYEHGGHLFGYMRTTEFIDLFMSQFQ